MKKLIILTMIVLPYTSFASSFPQAFQTPTPAPGLEGLPMRINYITQDGQCMVLYDTSSERLHKSFWDPIGQTWTTPQDMGFDTWDGFASLSPDEQAMYYGNHSRVYVDFNGDPSDDVLVPSLSGVVHVPISIGGHRAYFSLWWPGYTDIGWATYDPSDPVNGFGPVTPLTEINTTGYDESYPHVTTDHQTLLFHSNRPGGHGGTDIWRASWNGSQWVDLTNLGPTINTTDNEGHPFYCPIRNTLYFHRADPGVIQATLIPTPSALILGSIGLAFTSWKLRRRRTL